MYRAIFVMCRELCVIYRGLIKDSFHLLTFKIEGNNKLALFVMSCRTWQKKLNTKKTQYKSAYGLSFFLLFVHMY